MNKAKINYGVDVAIGIAGVVSAVSGLVFLLPGNLASDVLGVSYRVWNDVHTWSSLVVIAGVGAHLALHWKWLVAMTKQMLSPKGASASVSSLADAEGQSKPLSRRAFLALGGAAVVVTGLIAAGYKAIFDTEPAESAGSDSQPATTQPEGSVTCPFGLVNDPYPGHCSRYVDLDGDGFCDYSVPASDSSGSELSGGDEGNASGGFAGHRRRLGRP